MPLSIRKRGLFSFTGLSDEIHLFAVLHPDVDITFLLISFTCAMLLNGHLKAYGAFRIHFLDTHRLTESSVIPGCMDCEFWDYEFRIVNFTFITKISQYSCLLGLDFDHILQPVVIWKIFLHHECMDMTNVVQ